MPKQVIVTTRVTCCQDCLYTEYYEYTGQTECTLGHGDDFHNHQLYEQNYDELTPSCPMYEDSVDIK